MLRITVTAKNSKRGREDLREFEELLRSRYNVLCKSRTYSCRCGCRNKCDCTCKLDD